MREKTLAALLLGSLLLPAAAGAQMRNPSDPRVGLRPGLDDAGSAARGMELISHLPKPQGFTDAQRVGNLDFANSDMAFRGSNVFVGSFNGYSAYDVSDPRNPRQVAAVVCPGGQGDVSVYRNLLFMSVEQTRGRLDCGNQGVQDTVSTERFRGVRIFDISDPARPRTLSSVQTCRGSHTHTLVTDPRDAQNVYVYVSGTGPARSAAELPGCNPVANPDDPTSSYWSITVIRVPVNAPQQARVVGEPRIFASRETGRIAGLNPGGTQGPGSQTVAETNQCHDITVYPAIRRAAGACAGNGIILDISDPANPVRVAAVSDPNFAYWHSATFNNDGSKVLFTDEWGGGTSPRCRASDPPTWGANAIFERVGDELRFGSHYKLPAAQTETENCVAHNGSLVPVPGRDIKVQGWYQGGISVFDFTDPKNPVEIAFFDRGPVSPTELHTAGSWSAYWYNGQVYSSEIARGLDVLELRPSEHLSRNEIEAARLVRMEHFNPQDQPRVVWPAAFVVSRAYLDQLARGGRVPRGTLDRLRRDLDRAEGMHGAQRRDALSRLAGEVQGLQIEARAAVAAGRAGDPDRLRLLATSLVELANASR